MEASMNEDTVGIRDVYLARVVKGKAFAEIGGLWGATQEGQRCPPSGRDPGYYD